MWGSRTDNVTSASRNVAIGVCAALAFGIAAWQLNGHYPLRQWLFWVYFQLWLSCGLWAFACLSAGHAILSRLRGASLPLREHLLFSFACGVLTFAHGIFFIGLLGGLGPVAFAAWPLALIGLGGLPLLRYGRRALRHIRAARTRPTFGRPSPASYAMALFGAVGVLALYLNILTPANIAYDSRWYHLGVAEHYAAAHAIARFPEGWFPGALPQLASHLYTWAFLLPGGDLFTHVELAAHLEFVLFLATLAGIPVLVRWLLHGARAPMSWVALLLFPGIFVYDSTLSGAADHVMAFWSVPLFVAAGNFWKTSSTKNAAILAAMAAGAALTKYQALYLLAPIALGLAINAARNSWRGRSLRALTAPIALAAIFLVLTATHWLKNLIWYGDPLYPLLHRALTLRPWNPDADPVTTLQGGGFATEGTISHRAFESAKAMVTFSFEAHDWPGFHRDWPTFGFLFTLFLPFLVLLRGVSRMRALAAASLVGVFIWFWTFHQGRYLQALVPWMAAVVAAVIWHLWKGGLLARVSVVPLVALQIVWGGDHYSLPTHHMAPQHPMRLSMDLVASGYQGRVADRFAPPSELVDVGKTLPPGTRVLIHESHLRLGIGAPSVSDARGTQGALSYRRADSPRALWEKLRGLGVTHVLWSSPMGLETYGDEAVFYDFVTRHLEDTRTIGAFKVGRISASPPPSAAYRAVAILGCGVAHKATLPEVDAKIWTATPPPLPAQIEEIQRAVGFILVEASCRDRFPTVLGFKTVTSRNGWETWSRDP